MANGMANAVWVSHTAVGVPARFRSGNKVNTVNFTKAELLEYALHPLPANVSEDTRDTDAVCSHGLRVL